MLWAGFAYSGGGAGPPRIVNVVRITNAGGGGSQASGYVTVPGDAIEFDGSDGLQSAVKFEATPSIGSYHLVLWWKWTASTPPPVVDFNGKQGTPYSQATQTSGALVSTTAIVNQGAAQGWLYDGTQWVNAS